MTVRALCMINVCTLVNVVYGMRSMFVCDVENYNLAHFTVVTFHYERSYSDRARGGRIFDSSLSFYRFWVARAF